MTTEEVAKKYDFSISYVARWALNNGVERAESINGIQPYNWTDEDVERFEHRRGRGWQKGRPRK